MTYAISFLLVLLALARVESWLDGDDEGESFKTARVYQAPTSTRRYLSKQAAYMRWAHDLLRARFEAEHLTGEDFDSERYERVAPRLARWLKWRDERRAA